MVDLAIGLGLPALQMALREFCPCFASCSCAEMQLLEFIVQGHRYDIWEGVGCYPTTVNTPAAYPLSFLWPIVIGLVSAFYCSKLLLFLTVAFKLKASF